MPKYLTIDTVKTPNERRAYVDWAVQQWNDGQFKPFVKELMHVFPKEKLDVAITRAGLNVAAPSKPPLLLLLKEIAESHMFAAQGNNAAFLSKIATRLVIEAAEAKASRLVTDTETQRISIKQTAASHSRSRQTSSPPIQQRPSDQHRAAEAFQAFLKNPNDNNHLRLSRLLSTYAAAHRALIKQDYPTPDGRSESVRAFSGGGCSPR